MGEPLGPDDATHLIHQIAREGDVAWSQHALEEMHADNLTTVDCVHALRAGAVDEPAELIMGSWRYRIHTQRIWPVVAIRSETEIVVVTAWRRQR